MKNRQLSRRELFVVAAGAMVGGMIIPGCVPSSSVGSSSSSSGSTPIETSSNGQCSVVPTETAGPYPAHDSAKNVLTLTGVERSDIRSSLNAGSYTGTATATGVPLTITLNLKDVITNCTVLSGYAVYLWHCDRSGNYSMYSSSIITETYLRGVQETDSNGSVTFQTIFPGCYDGRMPHMHFEIFPSVAQAISSSYVIKTSQLTFPLATLNQIYNNVSSYSSSKTNLARITYATDNVFSDGYSNQVATIVSGDNTNGYVAKLDVGINA
jgi:protocatechuate 3,4-dioxygenase beta subunit